MPAPLIIALDFPSPEAALQFIKPLSPSSCRLKVGFELFVRGGPDFVRVLVDKGFDVFLDLKFHDIPNTVAAACRSVASLEVWMINVHALGGSVMLQAARDAIDSVARPPHLIAVTLLTSFDQAQLDTLQLGQQSPEGWVEHLAELTEHCGLDGVVCSAQEAALLRQQRRDGFLLVTPGIRLADDAKQDDQVRIMTPTQARQAGVSYMVVGRPITRAENPLQVIQRIQQNWDH